MRPHANPAASTHRPPRPSGRALDRPSTREFAKADLAYFMRKHLLTGRIGLVPLIRRDTWSPGKVGR